MFRPNDLHSRYARTTYFFSSFLSIVGLRPFMKYVFNSQASEISKHSKKIRAYLRAGGERIVGSHRTGEKHERRDDAEHVGDHDG